MPATIFTRSLFGIDPSFIQRAEALAAEAIPVVRTNLLDRADRMTRMLRSRG